MLAQAIHEACLRNNRFRRAARLVRRARLMAGDPAIHHKIGDVELSLPMSHMLPIFLCDVSGYMGNFSRIVKELSKTWPTLHVLDVGANVGDTLALVLQANPNAVVLCVEGNPGYFRYLSHNAENFGSRIYLERSYLGTGVAFSGDLTEALGTAHLVFKEDGSTVATITLEQLLARHPDFGIPHFIKVDTDGFDALILDASMNFLGEHGPLIFAEVDAGMARDAGGDWEATIGRLVSRGYTDSIWWTNRGRMVCRCDLNSADTVADLLHFIPGGGDNYSDVLFARIEHSKIMEAVRDGELRCD